MLLFRIFWYTLEQILYTRCGFTNSTVAGSSWLHVLLHCPVRGVRPVIYLRPLARWVTIHHPPLIHPLSSSLPLNPLLCRTLPTLPTIVWQLGPLGPRVTFCGGPDELAPDILVLTCTTCSGAEVSWKSQQTISRKELYYTNHHQTVCNKISTLNDLFCSVLYNCVRCRPGRRHSLVVLLPWYQSLGHRVTTSVMSYLWLKY